LILFLISSGFVLFVLLAITGMVLISTSTVSMVMAQTLLPRYLGMASGLMVGFAMGTGGIGVTLLGIIADHWGIPMALRSIITLPLIGFVITLLIKYPPKPDGEGVER
jgi:FSR family fosmidomycin resistance protein-like MFS transporter